MIWVGTSGFQYEEWKGTFYPETLSKAKMLPYYAARFNTTEVNYSFRCIPSEKTLTNWAALTSDKFQFSMKALQLITHIKKLKNCEDLVKRFSEALQTLGPKLGPVLFQLPPTLLSDTTLLSDFLALLPENLRSAFEFRHESWFNDATFAALKAKNAALCIADTEDLKTPTVITSDFSYFRLRNPAYTKADISRWAKVIGKEQGRLKETYVYFRHEDTGTGPKFARQLLSDLGIAQSPSS